MTISRNNIFQLAILLCAAFGFAGGASAQATPPQPPPAAEYHKPKLPKSKAKVKPPTKSGPTMGIFDPSDGVTSEKSVAVDPNVSIKLCVQEGDLKINGWDRGEMRIFVRNGSRFGVRVLEKDAGSGKPVWLLISNAVREGAARGPMPECISGESIEIDVPIKASLSVTGRATQTTVDSVKKIYVKNIEGNIVLRNIPGGITALTYQGDVSVENSSGAISLESATGNIVAYEVSPGQIGDLFKAKTTSGAISLQRLEHRQIEANSITGSVFFNGKFLAGGLYNFKTSNGSIRMLIPSASSCTIKAAYGFGSFNSDIPLKIITDVITSGGKNVVGTIGAGDASVNLTTSSGSIGIKKQN